MRWISSVAARFASTEFVLRLLYRMDGALPMRLSEKGMLTQAFAFAQLNGISGDYMEFGLWRGRTFLHAYRMKRLHRLKNMHLWGFDSFQGLPPVAPSRNEIWSQGQFACSEQEFRAILRSRAVPPSEFTLVSGFYEQALDKKRSQAMAGRTAAIVYIDCDLYESTVPVLRFIEPLLVDGTIVCFDDFYCYAGRPDCGEQRALTEFLQQHRSIRFTPYLPYCPTGQSFIVHRMGSGA
jgi:O-methyltransferase